MTYLVVTRDFPAKQHNPTISVPTSPNLDLSLTDSSKYEYERSRVYSWFAGDVTMRISGVYSSCEFGPETGRRKLGVKPVRPLTVARLRPCGTRYPFGRRPWLI